MAKAKKSFYKDFLNLRENIQNRTKILRFKKVKWSTFLFHLNRKLKKKNLFYRVFDQNSYYVSKFTTLFKRRYKKELQNKSKLNILYGGLSDKYIKKNIEKSIKKTSFLKNTFSSQFYFIESLERRLDVIILRSHFVLSVRNARQLICHGHVFVNGVRVTKSNYFVKKGDTIIFSQRIYPLLILYVSKSNLWPLPPKYIQINYRTFQIIVVDKILYTNISLNFNFFLNLNSIVKKY